MRKYDFISALAKETAAEVVKNREEWMKYLTTAARLYKYPFREQLLIYAQRPDATACASIELWNERMHCWVNKGAKGIALLDEDDAHGKRLKYVFDVSDVHAARRIGRYPELWELHEEHKEDVIKRLEQTYGATDDKKLFEETEKQMISNFFESFGMMEIVPEYMMNAVVCISSSAPAYIYMFIEALADAGVKYGMPRDVAYRMAAQGVVGSAKMVLETGKHPGALKDDVCSPGGTTIYAVSVLEEYGLRNAVIKACDACYEKCIDLK